MVPSLGVHEPSAGENIIEQLKMLFSSDQTHTLVLDLCFVEAKRSNIFSLYIS